MKHVFALLLLALLCAIAGTGLAQTTHNVTEPFADDFICTGNAAVSGGTALAGDPTALETLRQWCTSDPRCSELYGQDGAPNLALFTFLFQTTLTAPVSSVFLETPLFDLLCNKTSEQFLMAGWVLLLVNQMLDAAVCDVNERPVLDPTASGGVNCVCQPGKTCDSDSGSLVVGIIILVAVVVALVVQFGVVMWNRTRQVPLGRAVPRQPVPQPQSSGPPATASPASGLVSPSNARYRARGTNAIQRGTHRHK